MNKSVELPICWHTDETKVLDDCDIDFDIEDTTIKKIVFYRIDFIYESIERGKTSTIIKYNEGEFICPLPRKKVEEMIRIAFQ